MSDGIKQKVEYVPGIYFGFLRGVQYLCFLLSALAIFVDQGKNHGWAGVFVAVPAIAIAIYRSMAMVEVQLEDEFLVIIWKIFNKKEQVKIKYKDILEVEILTFGSVAIELNNGKRYKIARGIAERPEDLGEIELPISERHNRIAIRLKKRIEDRVSAIEE